HLAFTYDDADRILTATTTATTPNALPTSTLTYVYDNVGNVLSEQRPGGTTGYSYDALSRLASVVDPVGGAFAFGRDAVGRLTALARPNGITDATTYDAAGNLDTLHSTVNGTIVNQGDYTYNADGRRGSVTTAAGVANFAYDAAGELTSTTQPPGA